MWLDKGKQYMDAITLFTGPVSCCFPLSSHTTWTILAGSFCDEPPSDIRNSQPFIRKLVETVVASICEMGEDSADHYLRRARRILL